MRLRRLMTRLLTAPVDWLLSLADEPPGRAGPQEASLWAELATDLQLRRISGRAAR
ncbi:hypothetical protein AB0M46_43575 [Dactylosporangium sp. NPDC051485]|uniref:hypothetical protein n=1 Tax=Dactylosporangium sp. NPDC051485 TaxID=3154846 RepID=UPI0034362FFA